MKYRRPNYALTAGLCLSLTGMLIPGTVKGQAPSLAPPPPMPISGPQTAPLSTPVAGQDLPPPPPAPPASHALPPSPQAPAAGAGSPFRPAAASNAPTGRPRLFRRRSADNPPGRVRLRDRIRNLFQGGGNN